MDRLMKKTNVTLEHEKDGTEASSFAPYKKNLGCAVAKKFTLIFLYDGSQQNNTLVGDRFDIDNLCALQIQCPNLQDEIKTHIFPAAPVDLRLVSPSFACLHVAHFSKRLKIHHLDGRR